MGIFRRFVLPACCSLALAGLLEGSTIHFASVTVITTDTTNPGPLGYFSPLDPSFSYGTEAPPRGYSELITAQYDYFSPYAVNPEHNGLPGAPFDPSCGDPTPGDSCAWATGYADVSHLTMGGYAFMNSSTSFSDDGDFAMASSSSGFTNGFTLSAAPGYPDGTPVTIFFSGSMQGSVSDTLGDSDYGALAEGSGWMQVEDSSFNTLAEADFLGQVVDNGSGRGSIRYELTTFSNAPNYTALRDNLVQPFTASFGTNEEMVYDSSLDFANYYGLVPVQVQIGQKFEIDGGLSATVQAGWSGDPSIPAMAKANFFDTSQGGIVLPQGLIDAGVQVTFDAPPTTQQTPEPGTFALLFATPVILAIRAALRRPRRRRT